VDGAVGGDREGRCEPCVGDIGAIHRGGDRLLEVVEQLAGPGLESPRRGDHLPEAGEVAADRGQWMPLVGQVDQQGGQRRHRGGAGRAVGDRRNDQGLRLRIAVEEHVLLAREVREDGRPGHVGGLGDLRHRDVVEPTLQEERGGDLGDPRPELGLLPLPAAVRCVLVHRRQDRWSHTR
jgi:hypothetical protein